MEYLVLVIFLVLVIVYLIQELYNEKNNHKLIQEAAAELLAEQVRKNAKDNLAWEKGQDELEEMYQMTLLTEKEKYYDLEQEFEKYKSEIQGVVEEIQRDIPFWENLDGPVQNSPSDGDIHG